MNPRLVTVFTLLISVASSQRCADIVECGTCAESREGFIRCEWCANGNSCQNSLTINCTNTGKITHGFDCPTLPGPGEEYDPVFVRNVVFPLIGATNGEGVDEVTPCLLKAGPDFTFYNQYTRVCDQDGNTCSGYIALSASNKAIVLAFRATLGNYQLVDEIEDFFENSLVSFPATGGKVDDYFYNSTVVVWNAGMENDLKALVLQYPDYEIWTVGHSLGGAMASMVSAIVSKDNYVPKNKIKLVTFGQPRTGDMDYAAGHDSLISYRHRVIHKSDLIPHLPPRIFDTLVDSPYHHRYEVWYNNDMDTDDYQICDRADDDACSATAQDLNIPDHQVYFGKNLTVWYQSGCVV